MVVCQFVLYRKMTQLDLILFPYRSLQSIENSSLQVLIIYFHLIIVSLFQFRTLNIRLCALSLELLTLRWYQFSSVAQSCPTLCDLMDGACQVSLFITNSRSLLKLISIESVRPSYHLMLCHPLLLPSSFPSIRVFSNESALCIRWPKQWSFSFNISPSNEYSRLISFRMDWFDLLAVQGTLKSLLQHHSSKASILWHSPFFVIETG